MESLALKGAGTLLDFGVLGVVALIAMAAIVILFRALSKARQSHLDDTKTSTAVLQSIDLQMKVVDLAMRSLADDMSDIKATLRDMGRKS